jgi:hypothetical protein
MNAGVKKKKKKTANGAVCDAVNRLHQGVLYIQNVIWFHGI